MQIVTSWMEQGLEQGKKQGKQEEARSMVMRLLTRRFGQFSPELQESINGLTTARLEDLVEAQVDFTTVDDLQGWLAQN